MKGNRTWKWLLIATMSALLCGCTEKTAAVQGSGVVVVALATPVPTAQVVQLKVETTAAPSAIPLPPELWSPAPTLEPTVTPEPTATPEPTPEPTEEPTATPKATSKVTKTPRPTGTPKPTNTPKPTAAPTAAPTATPLPTDTPVPTETPVPTATPAPTPPQQVSVPSGARFSGDEVLLAARVAYFESNKSSEEGLRAVVCVILNRVESSRWPNSVYDVVYQNNQFTVVKNSSFLTTTIPERVIGYANDVLNNGNRPQGLGPEVMSFKAYGGGDTAWGDRTYVGTYGGNAFYS